MSVVYLNGSFTDETAAAVSVFDHGLVTGDGVFETILIREGRTFALGRHLDRLERSGAVLGIEIRAGLRTELEQAAGAVTEQSGLIDGKVRITVTSGCGPLASSRGSGDPTVIVAAAPIEPLQSPAGHAAVAIVPWPRNERGALSGAKTISYAENVVALAWAKARGAGEAVLGNLAGNLCEGTGSNVFIVHGGQLLTPPLSAGCLAGVTRALLLESGVASERDLPLSSLEEVTEAFLCSTTRGVLPIARIGDRALATCPGALTAEASHRYTALLAGGDEP